MKYFTESICGRTLHCYLPDATDRSFYHGKRPGIIVFPGGGYESRYEGEGEPMALRFVAHGIPAFVLDYTVTEKVQEIYPKPLIEAFAAVRYVRENAVSFGIDPNNITTCGFSAGGHLCGCMGTLWDKEIAKDWVGDNPRMSRPDKMILSYAVLHAVEKTHSLSIQNLLGKLYGDEKMREAFDLVMNVNAETSPAFIWATAEDEAVPVCASIDFAQALDSFGIPFELHIWPHGHHGLCLGDQVTEAHPYGENDTIYTWIDDAIRFIYDEKIGGKKQ